MIAQEVLLQKFSDKFSADTNEAKIFFAPGRVCLIGEHIDYNGGLVLPAAISLGIHGVFKGNSSQVLKLRSGIDEKEAQIRLDEEISFDAKRGWANYPAGVVKYLLQRGIIISGGELLFESDLPVGAGLSSSAAIEVLTAFIFTSLSGFPISNIELAKLCKEVENKFIGVQCGIMDQFAVAMGKKKFAMQLNCNSLEHKYVPVDLGEYSLVLFNTNKKRELTDGLFNQRVSECQQALESIRRHRDVESLADADEQDVNEFVKNPIARKRAFHVVQENIRVQWAGDALRKGDVEKFGSLLFQSHESLSNQYEVTGKELDAFFTAAHKHPACIGAKMSGAGFGGCAFAVVKSDFVEEFKREVLKDYLSMTGINGEFFAVNIEDGVRMIH